MSIAVSIVTGTYNRLESLKRTIESVRRSVGDLSYEIIIVDGGSTDGTQEWCKTADDVQIIEQGELLGAIKAFNAGAYASQGEYVVLLNDDVELVGDTIWRAYNHLQERPFIGQVGFRNRVKGTADKNRLPQSAFFGYPYGQCCMTPRHLGNLAGWWGDEGMKTYGGDSRFSLRLWEMGYPTVHVNGCAIIDYVIDDELRRINNKDARGPSGGLHPDTAIFNKVWKGRLPSRRAWTSTVSNMVLAKAARGSLRTLRFKGMMRVEDEPRTAMINAFRQFGPTKQVLHTGLRTLKDRKAYQESVLKAIKEFRPDLVLFQGQREHKGVHIDTIRQIRQAYPKIFLINWDGDTHSPLKPWHKDIAKVVHLQLSVSPSLFAEYRKDGAHIGWWPIGIEQEYIDAVRVKEAEDFKYDIVFLGGLFGRGIFPGAECREKAIIALEKSDLDFSLWGLGWENVGIPVHHTSELHEANAGIYAQAKMAVSVSQTAALWGYTSDRLYNITATGCPALVRQFAGMREHGYIDGETCITWLSIKDLLDKARYYLAHDEEREAIGLASKEMTLKRHTWEARLNGLFAMLGGLEHG